jgi:AAA domain
MFKKAEKKQATLKLAVTGPAGSGKTFSALRLAKGLGGKLLAVIDTENGSASLYSDRFDFEVHEITAPFTTEKYIDAIKAAEKGGFDCLIVDSLTHAWAGPGGLLEQKESLDRRPGSNSYTNWAGITKKQDALTAVLLQSPMHVIVTMRSKQDYALQTNDKGKLAPVKLGMAPVQRDGLDYEFTVVFDVAMDHLAQSSKDRTELFGDQTFQITEDTGARIAAWLKGAPKHGSATTAQPAAAPRPSPAAAPAAAGSRSDSKSPAEAAKPVGGAASVDRRRLVWSLCGQNGWEPTLVEPYLQKAFGKKKVEELTLAQFEFLCAEMKRVSPTQAMNEAKPQDEAPISGPPLSLTPDDGRDWEHGT